jgi:Domain of unknown function (DUF4129)
LPGKGAPSGADMRRTAAVLLLLAIAAVGLRAGGAFSAAGSQEILGMSGRAMIWIIAAVEAVGALAGVALLVARLFMAGKSGDRPKRKRWSLWWLLLLPFAVFGLAHGLSAIRRHLAAEHPFAAQGPGAGLVTRAHSPPPGSPWPLLVILAVAAVAGGLFAVYRRRKSLPPDATPGPAVLPLEAALEAGEQALRDDSESDPRAAIIGCYAAMERSLTDAGSPPGAADTPAEVLARATTGGLVKSAGAGTLTGLFRRARYSSHPMTEADRAAATGALAGVRAELAGRSEAGTG